MLSDFKFGLGLTYQFPHDNNLLISPTSVGMALAMTALGARGYTKIQMNNVLYGTQVSDADIASDLLTTLAALRSDRVTIEVANRLFAQDGYPFDYTYTRLITAFGGLELMQFNQDPEAARERINAWVLEKTHEKIRDLLPAGSIDFLARLVLVNAVYFYGRWQYRFREVNTATLQFRTNLFDHVNVPMMRQSGSFGYLKLDSGVVCALPYEDPRFSMLTFLPEAFAFQEMFRELSQLSIPNIFKYMESTAIDLQLPRFRVPWGTFSLKKALVNMGMLDAFSPRCDLSRISTVQGDLYLSDVFHRTCIDVNEDGAEAAAATAVVAKSRTAEPARRIEVVHNRPFMFAIVNREAERCLFLGQLCDPTK